MNLSVIIVNYNVEHFLEQCLHSVRKACSTISAEIFVVDNNSVDGSVAMVKAKFPEVKLIANKENFGFSKANNQAIKEAKGEYILLLNPDTIVEEDTFTKIIQFMNQHLDAGALGVKMIDGKGNFLPESKRGLPTPLVAFYKIFGFSKLFPKSKILGRYHLGFLDENEINKVDVLAGAFMFMRKSALEKSGLLDENFFMYGEDIDLSYRITKAGYNNYYYPETRIIHYKGESTKKSSVNYVFVFYNAMVIFARKHFSKNNAATFSFLIHIAIYLRAFAAILNRGIKKLFVPAIDFSILLFGLFFIKNYYEQNIKFTEGGSYSNEIVTIAFPSYVIIWILLVYLSGGYDKPIRLFKIIRGIFWGTITILLIYSLLPETYRFSRAIILLGSAFTLISYLTTRILFHFLKIKNYTLESEKQKRILIIGEVNECTRVSTLLKQSHANTSFIGYVSVEENQNEMFIGRLNQLDQLVSIYDIDEIIFSATDLPSNKIIDLMLGLGNTNVDFKIAPPESLSIIGSNSIETAGDLYTIDINSINKSQNIRNKRLLDAFLSFLFIPLSPILIFFQDKKGAFLKNIFAVLFNQKSWVGYEDSNSTHLPKVKKGVLSPSDAINFEADDKIKNQLNIIYAKDYKPENDLKIIWKGLKKLGH